MYISIVDIVIVGIIALIAIRGALRGFVKEVLSMAALVIGLLFAIFFFRRAAVVVNEQYMPGMKTLSEIISFVVLFLVAFAAVKLVEVILRDIIKKIQLTGVDRLLGFFYGLAEGIVIVYLLLFLINIQPFIDTDAIMGRSLLAEKLMQFLGGNAKNIQDAVESIVRQGTQLTGMFTIV
jgi:membrane protein required for colicin V production